MEIPADWKAMLADLQRVYPHVVLAGGALRDLDHGISVKDLDIFVQCGDTMDEARGLNKKLGGQEGEDPDANEWYGSSGMAELVMVTDYNPESGIIKNLPDIPVQFVFCDWQVQHIMERFDYGLCRIMYDGTELRRHPDYVADAKDKIFNLRRCKSQYALARSVERYVRWKPRYPDYEWHCGVPLVFNDDENVLTAVAV